MADDMGILRVDIEIENHSRPGDKRLLREVMVDTGAWTSVAPAEVLESMGIAPRKSIRLQQADGSVLERRVGFAIIYAGGTETCDEIVFGEPSDIVVLGARTLEGLNVKVDLVGKRLVPGGPIPVAAAALSSSRQTFGVEWDAYRKQSWALIPGAL
jgi:predicted aspartyl protease